MRGSCVLHPLRCRRAAASGALPVLWAALASLPRRQRRFLELAWKNFEIATQPWRFETTALTALRQAGLTFADATLDTVARCQQCYIEHSTRIQEHARRYGGPKGMHTTLTELSGAATSIHAPSPG